MDMSVHTIRPTNALKQKNVYRVLFITDMFRSPSQQSSW